MRQATRSRLRKLVFPAQPLTGRNEPGILQGLAGTKRILASALGMALLPWIGTSQTNAADPVPLRVPKGLIVEEYAGDDLVHDVFSLTIDGQGRPVASGPGYVKILEDQDGDGRADRAIDFVKDLKTGAQGMVFHGRSLLCLGDAGLLRYRDDNADDQADGPPDVFLRCKTGGEHDMHSIQQGPEGWWYLLGGNTAEIGPQFATLTTSPVKYPRAGALLRMKPDLTGGEIVADGLRNAYDFTFGAQGDLFTFDSDDERENALPWYQPIRVFHMLIGADHGWITRSWKRPSYFLDMPPEVASFGRGSPTGLIAYRHTQLPKDYHGALIVLDWTYGRVFALPMTENGASWKTEPILLMESSGDQGFAPTDVEVAPDGSLLVSVGGRGTRGGIYRLRADAPAPLPADDEDPLTACLNAPQPLSSWSRQVWRPKAKQLGATPFLQAARDEKLTPSERVRAIEILTELFGGLPEADLTALVQSPEPLVRARALWSHGRTHATQLNLAQLNLGLLDANPTVVRSALEACTSLAGTTNCAALVPGLAQALGSKDHACRTISCAIVTKVDTASLKPLSDACSQVGARAVTTYAAGWLYRSEDDRTRIQGTIPTLAVALIAGRYPQDIKLDAIRLLQWTLGDMGPLPELPPAFDGYSGAVDLAEFERELDPLRIRLADIYPTGEARVDHELGRLIGMLQPANPVLLDKFLAQITAESAPLDDIHHLIITARMPLPRSASQRAQVSQGFVRLEQKLRQHNLVQDAGWNERMKEVYAEHAKNDPMLPAEIIAQPEFGQPGHVLFLSQLQPDFLPTAIAAFVKASSAEGYPWNTDVIFVLGESQDPAHRELIRKQADQFAVRNAVLMVLANNPTEDDRTLFLSNLETSPYEVMISCLTALETLPAAGTADEQLVLLKSLRRLGQDENEYKARERVAKLLERSAGRASPFVYGPSGYQPQPEVIAEWTAWLTKTSPETAAKLQGESSDDFAKLTETLAKVDWTAGSMERGQKLFQTRQCANCHGGNSALGPDLTGVAGRFSRHDLFTAIVAPSRDVSARYQTTIVETAQGKSYSGMVVYESVEGVVIRNATNQTFRLEAKDIVDRVKSPVSLMPNGLLKDLSPADYADLYAYLRSLTPTMATTVPGDLKTQ